MRLEGKRAIVTGSSSGTGRAIARLLAAEGASVVVNARGSRADGVAAIDAVVDEITTAGGTAIGVAGAVNEPEVAELLVARCVKAFGGVDIVVNNAGIYSQEAGGPVHTCSLETWRHTLENNLYGVFYTCRAALPHLTEQRWGRIVNAGSSEGLGFFGGSAYAASKSALFGLTRAMAASYGHYGITANCYNPESIGGSTTAAAGLTDRKTFEAEVRRLEEQGLRSAEECGYLLGIGGPETIAPWVVYLCTEEAEYLNGNVFAVEARRVALIDPPEEGRVLFTDTQANGPWSIDTLESIAPLAFPVINRWPGREANVV